LAQVKGMITLTNIIQTSNQTNKMEAKVALQHCLGCPSKCKAKVKCDLNVEMEISF
jgi:hypothetical protein